MVEKDSVPDKKVKRNPKTAERWEKEAKKLKAIQVAFDVSEEVQYQIRREALDLGLNPSDRIRQVLGLAVTAKPKRPRLTLSLSGEDFKQLAQAFDLDQEDHVGIKRKAAEVLIKHVNTDNPK